MDEPIINRLAIKREYAKRYGDIRQSYDRLFNDVFGVPEQGNLLFTKKAVEDAPADDLIRMIPYLDELSLKIVAGVLWERGLFDYLYFHGYCEFDLVKLKRLKNIHWIP